LLRRKVQITRKQWAHYKALPSEVVITKMSAPLISARYFRRDSDLRHTKKTDRTAFEVAEPIHDVEILSNNEGYIGAYRDDDLRTFSSFVA